MCVVGVYGGGRETEREMRCMLEEVMSNQQKTARKVSKKGN
jgi:hypothetical protein